MPASPEHLSAPSAYQRPWPSDAADADVGATFAAGFRDHRPGAPEAVVPAGRHVGALAAALSGRAAGSHQRYRELSAEYAGCLGNSESR